MEDFHRTFKEKCIIHAKAQFDVESLKTVCPNIYHQIAMRDWGPFTIPVDPYFSEILWEFYASYRARQQLLKLEDRTEAFPRLTSVWVRGQEVQITPKAINSLYWLMPSQNTLEVPIEVAILLACIMKHVNINVGEIIADQFRRKDKQQATTLPFPSLVIMLCLRAECPLWRSLDKTIQVHGVITLDTKTDKEALMIKRARYAGNITPPSPVESPHIATAPANAAKAILSMIQSALKNALQPAKDKLTYLCSKVDVLQSEVTTLHQEVSTMTAHTNQPMPYDPEVVPPQVKAPRSPLDDWWVGYYNNAEIMSDEEDHHHNPPPPPQIHPVYDIDPLWAPRGVATTSYHELQTLPDRWVAPGPGLPVTLPLDPMQPIGEDTTSWVFYAITYTLKPRPNR
ncbi:hypothetical protein HAX54_041361 [Datura stramonium]|uniref:Putative plant transposon protein domain-containing protein n=1 Tax=Datura stramonium TaxID=4076 RepID=A0ABS8VQG6_DATST|nr:hypothetical protein [Datura stramonium]